MVKQKTLPSVRWSEARQWYMRGCNGEWSIGERVHGESGHVAVRASGNDEVETPDVLAEEG